MKISVMITTRNRCDDLRRTLARLNEMNPLPDEVLVFSDGCNDGTAEMVTTLFPLVRLFIDDCGVGSIPARDQMLRAATGDWVLSLDDDSYPLESQFFEDVRKTLIAHPEAGVVTFPELRDGNEFADPRMKPDSLGRHVSAYANCAAIMHRETYLRTGGYPTFFSHAYEEPDYALQLYSVNSAVWFEPSLQIRHHRSSKNRSSSKTHHLNARNELWSVWIRCPMPWLILVSGFRIARQFQFAMNQGIDLVVQEPFWWWNAIRGLGTCIRMRKPIPWKIYYRWMILARAAATPNDTIAQDRNIDNSQ